MFSFAPKNDEEINALKNRLLLQEGVYPFIVKEISQEVSKSDNPMLKIRLGVLDKEGNERNLIDYLVVMDQMIFKLKHFCEAIGFSNEYSKGCFDPQKCVGRSGKVLLGIQKGNPKPDGSGNFPDKNSVKDYVPASEIVEKKPVANVETFNDDINF